jgi:hypothetical protein
MEDCESTHSSRRRGEKLLDADACENGAVIFLLRQSRLSIANKVYAAAKRDWECRYG